MSRTLLFGGSGFLGPIILEQYPELIFVGRTRPLSYISNPHIPMDSLDDLSVLDSLEFDSVIFLVGNSNHHAINGSVQMGIDYNVTPLKKALHYFQNRKLKKFICFTTILLYDTSKMVLPVGEKQAINPYINDYVFSKFLSEEVVSFYAEKVPSIVIRFSNIYGPTKLVRPDLIPTLIQSLLSPNETTVWSKKPIRDFLFLDDAAEAIMQLINSNLQGPINLGTGSEASVGEVVSILEALSGKTIRDLGKNVSGPMQFRCDISRVHSATGWKPRHTLEEGLIKTFNRMKVWAPECRWWESSTNTQS